MSNAPEKKGVSAVDFFCIGFGAIVGVGWAVSINGWMASCGGPIPAGIGYLVVLIMMVPIGLCYVLRGTGPHAPRRRRRHGLRLPGV